MELGWGAWEGGVAGRRQSLLTPTPGQGCPGAGPCSVSGCGQVTPGKVWLELLSTPAPFQGFEWGRGEWSWAPTQDSEGSRASFLWGGPDKMGV